MASTAGSEERDASRKRKPSTVSEGEKVYVCTHPGCGKSFMRSDHLTRHKLNHEPSQIFQCDRCPRSFVRPDLLKRHAERHDKREQSGLHSQPKPGRIKGSTSSKKKSAASHQQQHQQSISNPSYSPSIASSRHTASNSYSNFQHHAGTSASASHASGDDDYFDTSTAPSFNGHASVVSHTEPLHSPPIIDDYDHNRFTDLLAPRVTRSPSPESSANLLLDFSHITDQLNFPNFHSGAGASHPSHHHHNSIQQSHSGEKSVPPVPSPSPPPLPIFPLQPQHSTISGEGNENENTNPGGPSNFNASFDFGTTYAVASSNYDTPFLSASESNWLFNHADLQFDTPMPTASTSASTSTPAGITSFSAVPQRQHYYKQQQQALADEYDQSPQAQHLNTPLPPSQFERRPRLQANHSTSGVSTANGSSDESGISPRNHSFTFPPLSSYPASLSGILNHGHRKTRHVHFADIAMAGTGNNVTQGAPGEHLHTNGKSSATASHHIHRHGQDHVNGNVNSYPSQSAQNAQIQSAAYRTIKIGLATRNRLAKHLSAVPNLLSDHRFSAASLDDHLARFFEWDAYHYSIIHRATFEPDEASNHLLAAMIAIGAYFTSSEAHTLAQEIHKCNLLSLLSSPSFCARADMQAIQASLFLNVFGRMMSTYDDHETAHILYPAFLTMYRRSALFNTRNSPLPPDPDLHSRWIAWREEESSKRAAFMAYQFDIVCNTMFRQTGTLSAFQVQLTLPCNEDEWYAHTASDWHRFHQQRAEPPPFLTAMKAFLMPGLNSPEISPLARVVCLHGLLSVAFDMQWREYFLLGLSTHPDGLVKDWRPTLTTAYNCWKTRFDAAMTQAPTALGTQLLRNSIPIYAIAHVTLAVDVDELQIFAGKRRALGLPVPASVVDTTRRHIITWSGFRGKEAVWHAAHFLRSSLLTRRKYEDGSVHPIFLSWCLYLSCLCVHAYGTAARLTAPPNDVDDSEEHMDAISYLDVICASSPDAVAQPNVATAGPVCEAISRVLKEDTNWELAQEASQLLDKVLHEGS